MVKNSFRPMTMHMRQCIKKTNDIFAKLYGMPLKILNQLYHHWVIMIYLTYGLAHENILFEALKNA
jgi:hypothetical protein